MIGSGEELVPQGTTGICWRAVGRRELNRRYQSGSPARAGLVASSWWTDICVVHVRHHLLHCNARLPWTLAY